MKFCKHCGRELNEKEHCSCSESIAAKKKLLFAAIGVGVVALIAIAAILIATLCEDPTDAPAHETSNGTLQNTDIASTESSVIEPPTNSPGTDTDTYTDATNPDSTGSGDPSDTTSKPASETTIQDTRSEETTGTEPTILLDPFDYLIESLVYDRYNGAGTVSAARNNDALLAALKPSIEDEDAYLEYIENLYEYTFAVQDIDIEITPNQGLSNGDVITVTIAVPEFLANRVMNTAKTYTVEGLAEIRRIDILDMFAFSLKGNISGEADLVVNPQTEDTYLKDFWLQIEPRYDLSSGDEVTVTLPDDYVAHLLSDYGILPTRTVRVLTVPQLSEYVISADQLPHDALRNIAQKFVEEKSADLTEDMGISYGEVNIFGYYFLAKKPESRATYHNIVEIIVFYDMYLRGEYLRTKYAPIKFYNITQKPDGSVSISYESGDSSVFTTNIEQYLSDYESKYTVTHIEVAD